jgi:hypothetical protein
MLLLAFCTLTVRSDSRAIFIPQLQSGQHFLYEAHGRLDRTVKTESRVAIAGGPQVLKEDLANQFRLSIQEVQTQTPHPAVTAAVELLPGRGAESSATSAPAKIDFTIAPGGQLTRIEGLEAIAPESRVLWQFWIARFAFGWTFPQSAPKPGEKWKLEEPELSASAIDNLAWERETTYVRDDKCPVLPNETCAIFLTESMLKQKSSSKDSTPEDYRRHSLKTSGTAKGTDEVITYMSLKSGLILRASEDSHQTMEVTILKSDETNGVHYDIDVTSHFDTVFVPPAAAPAD